MKTFKTAWVVTVNMGYGHQRTAYPLKNFAEGKTIINANDYVDIPEEDRKSWETSRSFYEFISRFKRIPLIGEKVFAAFDTFQRIVSFYPRRDLSHLNFISKQNYKLIKKGWGKELIERLKEKPIPFVTPFFTPALMAEHFKYPEDIYCVICDADIARIWAPINPRKSKIKYCTPNERVVERLKLYGVDSKNIFLTGYPLPMENIGKNMSILKQDMKERLTLLDPKKNYLREYGPLVKKYLGTLPKKVSRPLTIMFAVGGAGAQKEMGIAILKSFKKKIEENDIKIVLVAGVRKHVYDYFLENIGRLSLKKYLGKNIEIVFESTIEEYFKKFNEALRKIDILWTKPSELSFYSALGLPIIIAPTIGSQEEFNKKWLLREGFGIIQDKPEYANEWLYDWLNEGYFAELAMQGFIEGEKIGAEKIKQIVLRK